MIYGDRQEFISNPTAFPDVTDSTSKVKEIQEPTVRASIIVPQGDTALTIFGISRLTCNYLPEYLGDMMDLCFSHRAEEVDHRYLGLGDSSSSRVLLTCIIPLSEIVTDFFDQLKSRSSGFASFEYVL